jgi:hypothetical protein
MRRRQQHGQVMILPLTGDRCGCRGGLAALVANVPSRGPPTFRPAVLQEAARTSRPVMRPTASANLGAHARLAVYPTCSFFFRENVDVD